MKVIGERIIIERKTQQTTSTGVLMEFVGKCGWVQKSNLPDIKVGDLIYYKSADQLEGDIYSVDKDNILAVGEDDD